MGASFQVLPVAKAMVGDLSRIEAVAKVTGMVNAEPDFLDHAKVVNGCSDILIDVLGEAGTHARSAVGMGSLPFGVVVEMEAILAVKSQLVLQDRADCRLLASPARQIRVSDGHR